MKNVLEIYKSDLKAIFKSGTSIFMMLALIIVPCLYAWFNIEAAWDPYGNTGGIKVAVANNDNGGTFSVTGSTYNAGDMLVESLEKNDTLDWCFVSEKDARNGVEAGDYYAALVIPQDFTENLLSITKDEIIQPQIKYLVNEKINPVTPIITKKGAETIQYELRSRFVAVVNGMIFKIANVAGNTAKDQEGEINKAVETIRKINDVLPEVQVLLDQVDKGNLLLKDFKEKTKEMFNGTENANNKSQDNLKNLTSYLNAIKMSVNETTPLINEALNSGTSMAESYKALINGINMNDTSDSIKETLVTLKDSLMSFDEKINGIIKLLEGLTTTTDISKTVENLKNVEQSISYTATLLDGAIVSIDGGGTLSSDRLNEIKKAVSNTCDLIAGINGDGTSMLASINKALSDTVNMCNDISSLFDDLNSTLNMANGVVDLFNLDKDLSETSFAEIKDKFPEIKEKLNNFVKKLDGLDIQEKKDELYDLLQIDWENDSTFLSSPIEIDKEIAYPIANYGSEITPFYSSLGLWVGALLLVAMTTYRAKNYKEKEFTARQEYLGKYLFFITMSTIQSIVLVLGDILVLGVDNAHPVLFILFGIFISWVFQTIIFTLTSLLGFFGKGLSLVILVLQVAASGGIYPIQVAGKVFEWINPFLPFTYSIRLFREAIGGITYEIAIGSILVLLAFLVAFLGEGIKFRKLHGKPKDALEESFKESGLK